MKDINEINSILRDLADEIAARYGVTSDMAKALRQFIVDFMPAKPKPASVTIANPCGHGCNKVGIDCDNCADKPVTDVRDARRKHLDSLDVCLDCGSAHEGECVNTNEAKDKPPVAFAIEGVPATAGECAAFVQAVDAVLGKPETRSCDHVWKGGCCIRCGAETIKPKPQMAGEGAIAIEIKRECDQCWHFDDGCPEGSDNSLHACAKWKKAYDPKYGQKAVKDLSNKETRLLVADLAKRIEVIELEMKWAQRR